MNIQALQNHTSLGAIQGQEHIKSQPIDSSGKVEKTSAQIGVEAVDDTPKIGGSAQERVDT